MLEHYGAIIGADGPYRKSVRARVQASAPSGATDVELYKLELTAAKLQSIAIAFLKRADKKRYGGLWSDLENQFSRGLDHFPIDLTNAHNLLLNYKAPPQQHRQNDRHDGTEDVSGMSFLQAGAPIPGLSLIHI